MHKESTLSIDTTPPICGYSMTTSDHVLVHVSNSGKTEDTFREKCLYVCVMVNHATSLSSLGTNAEGGRGEKNPIEIREMDLLKGTGDNTE